MTTERLGDATFPSGEVFVVDTGELGSWGDQSLSAVERAALPAVAGEVHLRGMQGVVVRGLPAGPLAVVGERIGDGPYSWAWRSVSLEVAPALNVARTDSVGVVLVDFAQLMFIDLGAVSAWRYDASSDGCADVEFWGLNAGDLAAQFNAGGYGADASEGPFGPYRWANLTLEEAKQRAMALERATAENGWRVVIVVRPHSDYYWLSAQIRSSETGSGALPIGGAQVCGFDTSWGDGVFPVEVDRTAEGAVVRVRIVLGAEYSDSY